MNDKIQAYREAVDGFYLDALNNLLSEPDELIVDMLVDRVKELDILVRVGTYRLL